MKRILKFLRLPATEQVLLANAAFLLAMVSVGLSVVPFKRVLSVIQRIQPASGNGKGNYSHSPEQITWAVATAGRYLPFARCLPQALLVKILFARQGYLGELHIGVAKGKKNELEAHAWVESEGRIVIGGLGDLSLYSE